jgi:hypothetical protein
MDTFEPGQIAKNFSDQLTHPLMAKQEIIAEESSNNSNMQELGPFTNKNVNQSQDKKDSKLGDTPDKEKHLINEEN